MPATNIAFIVTIDSLDTTVERIAGWLREKNIHTDLFCAQMLPSRTRLIIICELDSFAIGLTARRLRKVPGVAALECLMPKQINFRSTPPAVLQLIYPGK